MVTEMEEIKLVDEIWKDNLIGLTYSEGLKQIVALRHMADIRLRKAELDLEQLKQNKRIEQAVAEATTVFVLNPKTKKILDVGFNVAEDLFTNNFGSWLSSLLYSANAGHSNSITGVTLIDTVGTSRAVQGYYYITTGSASYTFNSSLAGGTMFQFGSGTNPTTRTTATIQTPFATAPENSRFNTGFGQSGPGTGRVNLSGAIAAGGNGTINEMCLFAYWVTQGNSGFWFLLARDVITPVTFVAGNSLVANMVINF
jgi:hypothetical protein